MTGPIETDTFGQPAVREIPGLIVVFSQQRAVSIPVPLDKGAVELGREHPLLSPLTDPHVSRRHLRVQFDGQFMVTELGSRNGTSVDGAKLEAGTSREAHRVIRAGDTVLIPARDLGPVMRHGIQTLAGRAVGPSQSEALSAAEYAASLGKTLQVIGERGTGKEALARAFHAAGPAAAGPFHAVRCAALPAGTLEQVLFGNGSGTGSEAGGYLRVAHGGTLLVDGVSELSDAAQSKLLHLLARGELLPLGPGEPERLDLRLVFATRQELRAEVEAGRLLEELYFRLAAPRVTLRPLRERPEEIPFLLQAETGSGLAADASLVEACLLRAWPGNVRELLAEVRNAAQAARVAGAASVGARFLERTAGAALGEKTPAPAPPPPARDSQPAQPPVRTAQTASTAQMRERITTALANHDGNISAAARELGVHRTQLRRWMDRYGVDPRSFQSDDGEDG